MPKTIVFLLIFLFVLGGLLLVRNNSLQNSSSLTTQKTSSENSSNAKEVTHPLSISYMRAQQYPGSDITIEQILSDGSNYHQYITSYKSEGLKIYALLTVPIPTPGSGQVKPKNGWPVILFNHGYIPPDIYRTNERYIAYVDAFSRNGYIVFKPDYRGNGLSQGQPEGAYYSPAYTIDDLNALSSIKKYQVADAKRVGVWGHSMGGNIALRDLVVRPNDVKAAVIWGGVVGSYDDLMNNWQRRVPFVPSARELAFRNRYRQNLISQYKTPTENPTFWQAIDPTFFVSDIQVPIQLDVGGSDEEVPVAFSQGLKTKLERAGKTVEYFEYPGADHNISQSLGSALDRSVAFFDKYLTNQK